MNCELISKFIVDWLESQVEEARQNGLVIGVSGGIDSAVTSTLCAKTSLPLICLNMPIFQATSEYNRAESQIKWLMNNFTNIKSYNVDLTNVFKFFVETLPIEAKGELALANSRSRLRMVTLYSFANSNKALVCGTGNKVEDYGIGFFTKYGDGGVDVSPIGDLVKSEVYELAEYLGIPTEIQKAVPTDGLWEGSRTDEEQIGATYDELEWAMEFSDQKNLNDIEAMNFNKLNSRQKKILMNYTERNLNNRHKMKMPPICKIPLEIK